MAEVRLCHGRGAQDFALKVYKSYLLESQNKHGKSVVHASCLSVGFLSDDIQKCDLNGVVNAADRAAARVCEDGYTRVKRSLCAGDENGKVVENYYGRGLEKQLLPRKLKVQRMDRNVPRYRSNEKLWRTFCNSHRRCTGHLYQFVFIRRFSGNGTRLEPLYKSKSGYYEILGVSPTATQAQIKTAYYKQSFVFHPDRNSGSDEATARFSDINEAYTVLGNKGLRKKYDRGLLSLSDLTATIRPSGKDTTGGSAKQQGDGRRPVVGRDFQGGVFDFDHFYRSYYNEQLQRQRDIRVRKEEILKKRQETVSDKKLGKMTEVGVGMLLIFAMGILMSLKRG